MVGGGVAGEADDGEAAGVYFAQHLGFHGAPFDYGVGGQVPLGEEVVGGFGGAGEGAGEYLGVDDDEALRAGHGVLAEADPDLEVVGVDLGFGGAGVAGGVVGVGAVDAEDSVDAVVGGLVVEDLAEGSATCAPSGEVDLGEGEAGFGLGFGDEGEEAFGVGEEAGVVAGAGAGLNGDDGRVFLLGGCVFGEPVSAVEEEEELRGFGVELFGDEEGA